MHKSDDEVSSRMHQYFTIMEQCYWADCMIIVAGIWKWKFWYEVLMLETRVPWVQCVSVFFLASTYRYTRYITPPPPLLCNLAGATCASDVQISGCNYIWLYMGPNSLCCVALQFLLFFSVSKSLFIRILLRHVTFYKHFTYIFIL